VIGGVAFLAIVAALFFCCVRRKKKGTASDEEAGQGTGESLSPRAGLGKRNTYQTFA